MSETRRNESYFCADTDATISRLIQNSEQEAPNVHDAFRRTDLAPGGSVMDVGCGPIGALLQLSDLVGPQGTAVGVDMDEAALQRGRTILDRAGRDNVRLVQANINEDPSDGLRRLGPFDAAYCRLFLVHQPDPAETLRRMAALLRPRGYIVAHELLLTPPPRSEPEVPEIEQVLRWLEDLGRKRGASPNVARQLHDTCRRAGLREVSQRVFGPVEARRTQLLRVWQNTLSAIRPLLLRFGVASEGQIDTALGRLVEAEGWEFAVLFPVLYVELVAQVPESNSPSHWR
jgi:ubiquinone/menaquinone biosynthesis C-methylase UbiE